MTTIEDVLTYIDGSNANGRLVVAWKPFTVGNVNAAGGELEWPIVDGEVSISLYANTGAQPTGSYYVAKYELENGAVYLEQWVVPNLPTVNLGQVRVSFPPSPSVMISPLQLTSLNAQPGMFLQWDGQRWVPAYPSTFNLDPNWIAITTDSSGNDVGVIGSPVHLGNSVTIHIPDAGLTSRGVVTTSPQSFGGVKTFANTVNISTSIKFALRSIAPVYGELLGFGTGGADTSLSFGGNIIASRVSPVDRPYVRADSFIGSSMDLATFGIVPTAVMPGSLANPARILAAFLLPVAGTVDWTGIGTDTKGALWLRTGTSVSAGFLYLDTAGNVTAREFRMDPYQHLNAPGVEATRPDATMVMYSGTTDWAGYGVNSTPEIWFRMGPNAAGAYYYFGAGGARFPGNLTVGNIVVTGGVTLPAGTYVPTSRKINIPPGTGLTGGGDLSQDRTLSVLDNTTTQKVEAVTGANPVVVRKRLNFIAGAGQLITVVDDPPNDRANVTITSSTSGSASPSIYSVNGTPVGTQPELNLVAGTNVILSGVNSPGGLNRVDITVTTSGGAAISDPTTAIGDLIIRGTATPSPLTYLHVGTTTGYVLTTDLTTAPYIKWADRVPITRQIIAGAGLGGGGALGGIAATDVTLTANVVSVNGQTGAVVLTAANVGGVPTTRQVIAGTGLTGGGALSSDVTLAVVNNTTTQKLRVSKAGALQGTRQQINFIEGSNVTLTVADVPGSDWVGVTVAATTSGMTDPTTTKGDLIVRPVGPPATRMGVGATDGMVLTVDSTDVTFGIKWKAVPVTPPTPLTPWTSDIDGAGFTLKSAGKIGIGTASPSALLHLNLPSAAGYFLKFDSTPHVYGMAVDGVGSFDFDDVTNAVRRITVTSVGNVGIGTASPQAAFHVTSPVASAPPAAGTYGGQVIIGDGVDYGMYLGSLNSGHGYIQSQRGTSAVTYNLLLQPNGGNVGIGTANPQSSLHVYKSQAGVTAIIIDNDSGGGGQAVRFAYGGSTILGGIYHNNTGELGNVWALRFKVWSNAAEIERMMIRGDTGNVGIGMTSPQVPLHIWNLGPATSSGLPTVYIGGTYTAAVGTGVSLRFVDAAYNALGEIRSISEASNQIGLGFSTWNTGAGERVRISAAGNVGIGTASPTASLHASRGDGSYHIKLDYPGTHNYGIAVTGGGGLTFDDLTTPTQRLIITPTGNVGIGAGGGYKLDIGGDVNCSGLYRRNGASICQVNTQYNQTGVRALNTVYQNNTTLPMFVSVYSIIASGSYIKLLADAGNPPTYTVFAATNTYTNTAGYSASGWVMPGHFYKADAPGSTLTTWTEWF